MSDSTSFFFFFCGEKFVKFSISNFFIKKGKKEKTLDLLGHLLTAGIIPTAIKSEWKFFCDMKKKKKKEKKTKV